MKLTLGGRGREKYIVFQHFLTKSTDDTLNQKKKNSLRNQYKLIKVSIIERLHYNILIYVPVYCTEPVHFS